MYLFFLPKTQKHLFVACVTRPANGSGMSSLSSNRHIFMRTTRSMSSLLTYRISHDFTFCWHSNSDKHVYNSFTLKTPSLSLSSYYIQDVAIKRQHGRTKRVRTLLSGAKLGPFSTMRSLYDAYCG